MAVARPQYVVHRSETIEYQPMFIDREQVGEAHMLRNEGSHGNAHEACLWRTDAPARYEYFFSGDESFYVLEGSVSIELAETGGRVELKKGDVASFPKGTRSVWRFSEPFKKFMSFPTDRRPRFCVGLKSSSGFRDQLRRAAETVVTAAS